MVNNTLACKEVTKLRVGLPVQQGLKPLKYKTGIYMASWSQEIIHYSADLESTNAYHIYSSSAILLLNDVSKRAVYSSA